MAGSSYTACSHHIEWLASPLIQVDLRTTGTGQQADVDLGHGGVPVDALTGSRPTEAMLGQLDPPVLDRKFHLLHVAAFGPAPGLAHVLIVRLGLRQLVHCFG